MHYFNIGKTFLLPSFDLDVKEQLKIERFLQLLDDSGVDTIISKYIKSILLLEEDQVIITIIYSPPFSLVLPLLDAH
jgi:hypothetical protein